MKNAVNWSQFNLNNTVKGWVVNEGENSDIPKVTLLLNGKKLQSVYANSHRDDLVQLNIKTDGKAGFLFDLSDLTLKDGDKITLIVEETGVELTNGSYTYKNFSTNCPLFLFFHIPKTAGTSFRKSAEQYFGCHQICRDYGVAEPTTSEIVRQYIYQNENWNQFKEELRNNNFIMVAGHPHMAKSLEKILQYKALFHRVKTVIFVRDPIQRLISEYYHHQRSNRLFHKSLEEYAIDNNHANRLFKLIKKIGIEDTFIGITEKYQESLELFNQKFGFNLKYLESNLNRKQLKSRYEIDSKLLDKIIEINQKDIHTYKLCLELFELEKYSTNLSKIWQEIVKL